MRTTFNAISPFYSGIFTGLALAGVALGTVGAVRRIRARRLASHRAVVPAIDGVRPPDEVELAVTPPREANSIPHRVEGDIIDPLPVSQRW